MAAAEASEAMLLALEGIGAAVECERPGEAYFGLDGLRGLYGGDGAGVLRAARGAVGAALGAMPAAGIGPSRLAAYAAALGEEGRGGQAPCAAALAGLPVALLAERLGATGREGEDFVAALGRLGIETLASLARISADQMADRFGPIGLRALSLARGEEEPLRPRPPQEPLAARLELPDGVAGQQLDRALKLLIDRLLALPQRRGRTLLGVRLGARLCAGGSWSHEQFLGRPSGSARILLNLLAPRLEGLPGPAAELSLRALGLGAPEGEQLSLGVGAEEPRRRLGEAVREVRAVQGGEALLKVLAIDPASRVPERWAALTPFPER